MVVKKKLDPLNAPKEGNITFKDTLKDGVQFIEVGATGLVILSKGKNDKVVWNVQNFTNEDFEVKVIDFYPVRIASTGQPTLGGTPFKGKGPDPVTAPAADAKGPGRAYTLAIVGDGDADVVYKYSIVARTGVGPWLLVKDPELELDL